MIENYSKLSCRLTYCTLDVIAECACGYEANAQKNQESLLCKAVTIALETIGYHITMFPFVPAGIWHKLQSGYDHLQAVKTIRNICKDMIESRKKGQTSKSASLSRAPKDFLDILLTAVDDETGDRLSDREILDEVITFIFAGHDTTATSLQYALFNIMTHPDVEIRVCQEIERVMGDRDVPSIEDLKQMVFLDCCLKESLRLHTTVPILGRSTDQPLQFGQYNIPKNVEIAILPYAIHRNPQIWESPDSFDPDRFAPENFKGRHPFAFVPFSAGPRNCLGQNFAWMEMKLILSMVIRKFHLRIVDICSVRPEPYIVLRPENGLKATVIPRQSN
eukprot:TRINITY_DN4266_c0_g3_i1.p1 TRINITY_DN4266_c0_g3~~TRINITY_DN4266_c0_g3_i1.p1  ORF type:complete len:334 (-),score=52.33 TRINITY_DN4266_c0_g3_i1:129-1130(-)